MKRLPYYLSHYAKKRWFSSVQRKQQQQQQQQQSRPPQTFVLPKFSFQCGVELTDVKLVYQTYGTLKDDCSNVILYPTSYGAQHSDIDWLIRPHGDGILDPTQWFILIPNMFGNGLSLSPTNSVKTAHPDFYTTHYDNVRAQKALLESLGILGNHNKKLALIYGWSMGAQQAYHWAALYPEHVTRVAALCGTAKTTDHNKLFLYSLKAALQADPTWNGTRFEGTPDRGFHAFAQIYASWAASQPYYQAKLWKDWGYTSLQDYISRGWEAGYRKRDPHNLLAMIETWLRCDVSDNPTFQGDYQRALQSIRAQTLVMPATTDLYFTPKDCEAEAALIPNAKYLPIASIWGHRAGNPYQNTQDEAFIRQAVQRLLET
eukprot:scaffold9085_cov215-Amphora_coffeaeformis.AAC.25